MSVGIVLVHGYSGSPGDIEALTRGLAGSFGEDSVTMVCLSGHGGEGVPLFDESAFLEDIGGAVGAFAREGRKVILLGHSTGGTLALSFLKKSGFVPGLLILASVPKQIHTEYLQRWEAHRSGKTAISFGSVARMVSCINTAGRERYGGDFPVLILQGGEDMLVTPAESEEWMEGVFEGPVRRAVVPPAGHDLFQGTGSALALSIVERAVADGLHKTAEGDRRMLGLLRDVEPEAEAFLCASPFSAYHIARCPSGRSLLGEKPGLLPLLAYEPVFGNIEITTRCNLRCGYCARSILGREGEDMSVETFQRVLGLLPHAYRVTIVGLGEPLLHPHVVDLVAKASAQGRRVALVTNAMLLDERMSRALLAAGLRSIAFSIDGPDRETAEELRPGTDIDRVTENIRRFVEISETIRPISTAVFSAVSIKTVSRLEQLVALVRGLGVKVLMLTDLNFVQNKADTLWKNRGDATDMAVRKAISKAFSEKLPVLSVHGLEEFGMARRYEDFLMLPPSRLYTRSARRTWCCSPWQTVPVDVRGNVTLCDCQPDIPVGSLLSQPLRDIWNGEAMAGHRARMLGPDPPEACRVCPRF